MELRPVVVDNDHSMTVLGGNMRVLAARELGIAELPYVTADNLTDEQKRRFIIADNVPFGEWDVESLDAWDKVLLDDYGIDTIPFINEVALPETETSKRNQCPNCGYDL